MFQINTSPGRCLPLRVAAYLSWIAPRGKGVIPRIIGRLASRWIHDNLITRHGARLPIIASALDVYVTMVQQESSWDYWILRTIEGLLKKNSVVYDVGANVGYLSVELANKRKDEGVKVFSFEPNGELAGNIEAAASLNGLDNLKVINAALGAEKGEVRFVLMPHSIHSSVVGDAEQGRAVTRVRQETIDGLVEDGVLDPPDIIKIDVEGYEFSVLQGARNTLRKYHPHVIFEISELTKNLISSPAEFEKFFREIGGYQICTLRGEVKDLMAFHLAPHTHIDLMAVPTDRSAQG